MAKPKRDGDSARKLDEVLILKFRGYAQALESGMCTSGNAEDMEGLVENLEILIREIREWAGLKDAGRAH